MTTENWIDLNDIQAVAIAQSEGWEIELQTDVGNDKYCPWKRWDGLTWHNAYLYRARPRQPVMKEVKIECWLCETHLSWRTENANTLNGWIRQPHLDMIAKVPE